MTESLRTYRQIGTPRERLSLIDCLPSQAVRRGPLGPTPYPGPGRQAILISQAVVSRRATERLPNGSESTIPATGRAAGRHPLSAVRLTPGKFRNRRGRSSGRVPAVTAGCVESASMPPRRRSAHPDQHIRRRGIRGHGAPCGHCSEVGT
jgi:hypothetical protein